MKKKYENEKSLKEKDMKKKKDQERDKIEVPKRKIEKELQTSFVTDMDKKKISWSFSK